MSFSSHFFDNVSTGLTPYGSANPNGQEAGNVFDYQFNESAPRTSPPGAQQQTFEQTTEINYNPASGAGYRGERSLSTSSSSVAQTAAATTGAGMAQPKVTKRARSNRSASSSSPAVGTSDLPGSQSPEVGEHNGKGKRPDRRAKFLERNRIAASKCRSKKKEWTNNLEAAARQASQQSRELHQIVARLRDELLVYKTELMQQRGCSCGEVDRIMQGKSGNASQQQQPFYDMAHQQHDHQQQMQHSQMMHQQQQMNAASGYNDARYSNYEATYMDGQ